MTTATRCCTCGNEIAHGADVFRGAEEDETACSALCRWRSVMKALSGWTPSRDKLRLSAKLRVLATRELLVYDPEVLGETELNVQVRNGGDPGWALVIVTTASRTGIALEIVAGEWCGEDLDLTWDAVLDVQVQDV
jgi:hypothetical protein